MNCIVSACPLSKSEFWVMAEYLSRVGSEMINATSFFPTPSIFTMSDIQGGSTNTGNVDWTRAPEEDLEIGEDDAIEVSLVKMDEWNCREKLKLEEKAQQREAQRKEQARKEAEAEERRVAVEKQRLEDFKRREARVLEQMEAQFAAQKKADEAEKRKAEGAQVVQQGRAVSSSKAGKSRQSTRRMSGPIYWVVNTDFQIFGLGRNPRTSKVPASAVTRTGCYAYLHHQQLWRRAGIVKFPSFAASRCPRTRA